MKKFLVMALLTVLLFNMYACSTSPMQVLPTQESSQTTNPVNSLPETTSAAEPDTTIGKEPAATQPPAMQYGPVEPLENFEFEQRDDGNYRITKYIPKRAGNVIIPETYNNRKIVEIANYAFNYATVDRVTLSKYIFIVDKVAFQTCEIKAFAVAEDNCHFQAVSGVLFNESMTELVRFPTTSDITNYVIPEGVSGIAFGAFSNCHNLVRVELPDSLRHIRTMAFSYCGNLSEVELPDGLLSIGDGAFYFAEKMTQIKIPSAVTDIGEKVFGFCNELKEITVDPQNACYQSIDGVLFDKAGTTLMEIPCGMTGEYQVPQGVCVLASEAFKGCKLTKVTLPGSLQKIGSLCFQTAKNLTTIQFAGTKAQWATVELGYSCFSGCGVSKIACSDGSVDIQSGK